MILLWEPRSGGAFDLALLTIEPEAIDSGPLLCGLRGGDDAGRGIPQVGGDLYGHVLPRRGARQAIPCMM